MQLLQFVQEVLEKVHAQTLAGGLKWKCYSDYVIAEPSPTISVKINFEDLGPDSAIWKSVFIKHPVGKGITMLGNPAAGRSIFDPIPAGRMLDQVNDIFRHVLLDPRRREFEAEMDHLRGL
jgi:hypothetical protein